MFCLTDVIADLWRIGGQKLPPDAGVDSLNELPVLLDPEAKPVRTSVVQQGISGAFACGKAIGNIFPPIAKHCEGGMGSGANAKDPRFAEAIIREPLLFNLAEDPDEETNVIRRQYSERAKEMAALLQQAGIHPVKDDSDD